MNASYAWLGLECISLCAPNTHGTRGRAAVTDGAVHLFINKPGVSRNGWGNTAEFTIRLVALSAGWF